MDMETTIQLTSADFSALVYSIVFFGGVICGWGFILGLQQRL